MVACLCFSEVQKISGVKCELLSVDPSKPNNGIKTVNQPITSKFDEDVENIDLSNEECHNNTTMVEQNVKNEIKIFENEEFGEMRTLMIDNDPWFVAKDIADKSGYAQTSNMMKRIDKEDSISSKLDGMNMKSLLINESGLYSAIIGSKLESAKRFKHWVTSEVLPSIRKHGAYMTGTTIDNIINNPYTPF